MPWLPYRLHPADPQALIDWCDIPEAGLDGPFFDPAIEAHRRRPAAGGRRTTPLAELRAEPGAPLPKGLIFHVSRCGSTLLARQLAALAGCRVLSEPQIVDTLLQAPWLQAAERRLRLHALLAAFAAGAARAAVLKLTARALLDQALIRAAAPTVPCIVLYRDPAEVLVALAGHGTALPPGLSAAGLLDPTEAPPVLGPVEFWARVLARQFAAACELAAGAGVLLLHYDALPDAAWQRAAPHFGLAPDAAGRAAMQAAAARNAKSGAPFADDRARKRAAVSDEIAAAVERWIGPHHARLEALRRAQPGA